MSDSCELHKCSDNNTRKECIECRSQAEESFKCYYECRRDACTGEATVDDCMRCGNDCSNETFNPFGPGDVGEGGDIRIQK